MIFTILFYPYGLKDTWIQNMINREIPLKEDSYIIDDLRIGEFEYKIGLDVKNI